jgi:predicted NAD/FAD-dependent oxidoreductase
MTKKIAIIGAGIAGLTVAHKLPHHSWQIDIFDKGRGVGGRMSSRRTDWGYLDHGCQYLTVKDTLWANFLQTYEEIISLWQGKFVRWQDGVFIPGENNNSRYVPLRAMNNLCKTIAQGLNVKLNTRIIDLTKQTTWSLTDEQGNKYSNYDMVIVTAPPAQTEALLHQHSPIAQEIKNINMFPCYSLMLTLESDLDIPFDGIELQHPVLGWIANNNSKPLRGEKKSLVIQSNFTWAKKNLTSDRGDVVRILKEETEKILNISFGKSCYESLHLWRYALPEQTNDQGYYLDHKNAIAVCGDWCLQGKVESAFLSANLLANTLKSGG